MVYEAIVFCLSYLFHTNLFALISLQQSPFFLFPLFTVKRHMNMTQKFLQYSGSSSTSGYVGGAICSLVKCSPS